MKLVVMPYKMSVMRAMMSRIETVSPTVPSESLRRNQNEKKIWKMSTISYLDFTMLYGLVQYRYANGSKNT